MGEYDQYKVEASREQLLEDFYQLMVGLDVIGGIKEDLMDEKEMEAWAELTVLHEALREHKSLADIGTLAPAPAEPDAGGADVANLSDAIRLIILTGSSPDAKTTTITAFVEEYTKDLRAELATAQDRIAALEAALVPFAEDYHNWLADNREETYLGYLDRIRDSDNVAISAALAYKLLHGAQQAQQAADGREG